MLSMPSPYLDGRVQTLNNMGAVSPAVDPITYRYLDFLKQSNSSVLALEIGAAYGNMVLSVLQNTEVNIVANDLDNRHIEILNNRVQECCKDQFYRLKTDVSNFPQEFKLAQNFDAILMARVAHFFSPEKFGDAVNKIVEILNPEGCVYLVGITPYVNRFASFISEYEKRIKNGEDWPGYIENMQEYTDLEFTSEKVYQSLKEKPFHFLSANYLRGVFEDRGFYVKYSEEFPLSYNSNEWSYDGRENVGIIACKDAALLGVQNNFSEEM
ncbi:MAG: class I SAM-dependent methyltransferase [Rickettsiales bacterium]|jgi:ubiquinone/menaquinone biosynthesis C-methylase UbiE|nr:class I SAM-dependent methyltransferase [Rickettsiales bacterium]